MNKATLREVIQLWTKAQGLLEAMKQRNGSGAAATESREAQLEATLEEILTLQEEGNDARALGDALDDGHLTKKGKLVLEALVTLEEAKLNDDQPLIVHWAAVLIEKAGALAAEYLMGEALDIVAKEEGDED
jgi:hypothetical protein